MSAMRILFTGASSFTGFWFARQLAAAGHTVVAPLRGPLINGADRRDARVARLEAAVERHPECPVGSAPFVALLQDSPPFDFLCLHGAEVGDYRSPDFDVAAAITANTRAVRHVLATFKQRGGRALIVTGSVFEPGEGGAAAVSAYGLAKKLSFDVWAFHGREAGLPIAKFVVANPFGPWEERRLCDSVVRSWAEGRAAAIRTPRYVRDHVPVSLLARAYARFVTAEATAAGAARLAPSFYVETISAFVARLARELGPRLGIETPVDLMAQTAFAEPPVRINADPMLPEAFSWSESEAWDELATYYRAYVL